MKTPTLTINMKAQGRKLLALLLMAVSILACERTDPTPHTVITAHGNTDWHIDTAEEFLYGTQMDGATTAANHVPDSWNKHHMHIDMTDTSNYYYDSSKSATGADTAPLSGIDQATLFFYAGHGSPTSFSALGESATQSNMLLGNNSKDNWCVLRYYWQCSCEVFAHGPDTCSAGAGTDFEYSCPDEFDGSADSGAMRNIYDRWGPALGQNLRMACGSSTSAYCHESEANRIWDNYNNKSYDVADSFIYGLHGNENVIPICITRGNSDVTQTPLYDQSFNNDANPVGNGKYLHIQYLSNFAKKNTWPIFQIPNNLPRYALLPMAMPEVLRGINFKQEGDLLISPDRIDERGASARVHTFSGAVSLLGPLKKEATQNPLTEDDYLTLAASYLREQDLTEGASMAPIGTAMKIQSRDANGELQEFQKNVNVVFKRQVNVAGVNSPIPVLGEGGTIEVHMNNDGSVFSAAKTWRKLGNVIATVAVKSYEQAYNEAVQQMGNSSQNYRLKEWKFGYKEMSGNVAQESMDVAFEFEFEPISAELNVAYPPQTIEIAGFVR